MLLATALHPSLNISSQAEILNFANLASNTIVVLTRIDLGKVKPIAGNGTYLVAAYINGLLSEPARSLVFSAGQTSVFLQSKELTLNEGDVLSVKITGLPADVDVDANVYLVGSGGAA